MVLLIVQKIKYKNKERKVMEIEKDKTKKNIKIIEKAHEILKKNYIFYNCTIDMQTSFFYKLSEKDYEKVDVLLRAIRQDGKKILIIMNSIKKVICENNKGIYKKVNDEYIYNNSAEFEIGCYLEYLFIKYKVLFEYIQKILEICIPYKLKKEDKKEFEKIKDKKKKFEYLLEYIFKNISENKKELITYEWFKKVIKRRNIITHEGATCKVYRCCDNSNFLFKVGPINELEKKNNNKEEIEYDEFYSCEDKPDVQNYKNYWGLQISKLIIFIDNIFEFLLKDSKRNAEVEKDIELLKIKEKDGYITTDGRKLPDIQTVLEEILENILQKYKN